MNFGKESETVEFKESLSQLKEGLISLTAMLNKSGQGTVYFGVNDDGELIGLKDVGKKTIHDISQAIGDGILPRIIPTVLLENKDGRDYILVSAKGYELPYSSKGNTESVQPTKTRSFPMSCCGDISIPGRRMSSRPYPAIVRTIISPS